MFAKKQRGYLLITVVVTMFLLATIAVLLTHGSAVGANSSNKELDADRVEYVARAGMQHALWQAGNNACMGDATIAATSLGNDSYAATLSGASPGTFFDLIADQDAWIRSDDVTKNNGTTADQHIRFESGNTEYALTRFDLSSLPANAQVNSATAWFYVTGAGAHPEGPITVHPVTAEWAESDATWETMSGNFANTVLATISAQPDDGVWVSFNLTGQVQSWVNGESNHGILFASTSEGVHGKYSSREDGGNAPRLEVVVGSGPASPVSIQATGSLANGLDRTLTRPVVRTYQIPVEQSISPAGSESDDAEIWAQGANNNYGDAAETWVSSLSGDTTRTLLHFNLGTIPSGAKVLDASLALRRQSGTAADDPISAHRILNPWSEDSVTWNRRESGEFWDTAGGDYDSVAVATTPVGSGNTNPEWDLTSLVQNWVDGRHPNYGIALVARDPGMTGERFYTSDQADLTGRPALNVTYACECGTPCMAPQGTGNILMVIGNSPSNPAASDVAIRDLFETWGYSVTYIQDDNSQGNFDAGMAANDMVFISETVSIWNIGSKLTNAPTGVVSAEPALNDELGIATGNGAPVSRAIDIVDNSHFITSVFQQETLSFVSQGTELASTSGTIAPGAQVLAQIGSDGGLVALETGATTSNGGNAWGRRVLVPVGAGSTSWNYLTNHGQLILQRSLAWAMDTNSGSAGRLLLVVGDSDNPSSEDMLRQSLIESWGYEVVTIDDSATKTELDSATAANDVVYVSEDIDHNLLADKLRSSTAGVVVEEQYLYAEFGFSAARSQKLRRVIDVIENSHYISSEFPLGLIEIYTADQMSSMLINPGIETSVLAELENTGSNWEPTVATIDVGDQLYGGGVAMGRRVKLPFTSVAQLNANGATLMRRAIEWVEMPPASNSPLNILFVVGNDSFPTTEELDHKSLLESWGHVVTMIDDDAGSAEFSAAAGINDIAYTTNDITASNLGTKLVDATLGIVSSEDNLSDEFGFSSSIAWESGTAIEINDNSHYITSPFTVGPLTFANSSESLAYLTGTQSPDLGLLASSSSGYGIVTLDTGAAMVGGGSASGRRVQLPWGGSPSILTSDLTPDGQLILRRAIEWASDVESGNGPVAHWKMDDGTGNTALDSVGGFHGTLVNGPAWVAGQLDGALSFDGSNDYIDVSSMNPISYDDVTISAWYKSADNGVSDDEYIFEHNDNFTYELTFGPTDDGTDDRLRFGFANGGSGTWDPHYGTSDIVDQQWHHVVGVREAGRIKLYVDGVLETDEPDAHAGATITVDGDGPFIGDLPGDTEQVHGVLDDVRFYDRALSATEIADLFAAGGGGGGGSGGPCDGTFEDQFNQEGYSNNDGTLSWSTDWLEINENDGWDSGDERVVDDDSEFHLRVRDNDGGGEGVQREADLSASANAQLTFDYRRDGFDNDRDYVDVEVSNNGGSSWTQLERIIGPGTDSSYVSRSHDISAYIAANTRIRFLTSDRLGSGDELYLDNIQIEVSGCAN